MTSEASAVHVQPAGWEKYNPLNLFNPENWRETVHHLVTAALVTAFVISFLSGHLMLAFLTLVGAVYNAFSDIRELVNLKNRTRELTDTGDQLRLTSKLSDEIRKRLAVEVKSLQEVEQNLNTLLKTAETQHKEHTQTLEKQLSTQAEQIENLTKVTVSLDKASSGVNETVTTALKKITEGGQDVKTVLNELNSSLNSQLEQSKQVNSEISQNVSSLSSNFVKLGDSLKEAVFKDIKSQLTMVEELQKKADSTQLKQHEATLALQKIQLETEFTQKKHREESEQAILLLQRTREALALETEKNQQTQQDNRDLLTGIAGAYKLIQEIFGTFADSKQNSKPLPTDINGKIDSLGSILMKPVFKKLVDEVK